MGRRQERSTFYQRKSKASKIKKGRENGREKGKEDEERGEEAEGEGEGAGV